MVVIHFNNPETARKQTVSFPTIIRVTGHAGLLFLIVVASFGCASLDSRSQPELSFDQLVPSRVVRSGGEQPAAVRARERSLIARFQSGESSIELFQPDQTGVEPGGQEIAFDEQSIGLLESGSDLTPAARMGLEGRLARVSRLPGDVFWDLRADAMNLASPGNLPLVLGGLGVGAWWANSNVDGEILEHIQDSITYTRTDGYHEAVSQFKFLGDGYVLLPVYAGAAVAGRYFFTDSEVAGVVGSWGERSFRGIVIGTPPLLVSQYVLGASRPGETSNGSQWQFFGDNNGVSGHSFMGAVPFLTAMHMTDDFRLKAAFFTLSTLPALSRMADNAHYPSQALLGWGLAYLVTRSVADTELGKSRDYDVFPIIGRDEMGLGVSVKY